MLPKFFLFIPMSNESCGANKYTKHHCNNSFRLQEGNARDIAKSTGGAYNIQWGLIKKFCTQLPTLSNYKKAIHIRKSTNPASAIACALQG